MSELVLDCDRAVLPDKTTERVRITLTDGLVTAVTPSPDVGPTVPDQPKSPERPKFAEWRESDPAETTVERVSGTVLPGFVDTHVHGGGGADLDTTDLDRARTAIAFHRSHGTTTMFASLVTAPIDTLCQQLTALRGLCASGELAGLHLEGPYLSANKCGAHDPHLLHPPTPAEVDRLLAAADGHLRMVTIAPELPGAAQAIDRFLTAGVTVAVGHTDAGTDDIAVGLAGGATVATHLFNAMRTIHHRTPGPVPMLLTDPGVMVELICDGVHVHPDVIALAIRAAGPQRVGLITDAIAAAGMADGEYRLGQLHVHVENSVAHVVTADGTLGSIAGSTLTMDHALAYVVQVVGIGLADAVQMASTTPAAWHGLAGRGRIEVGGHADLVVVDDALTVRRVMRSGRWIEVADAEGTAAAPERRGGS